VGWIEATDLHPVERLIPQSSIPSAVHCDSVDIGFPLQKAERKHLRRSSIAGHIC
jgi:hypothetical protein